MSLSWDEHLKVMVIRIGQSEQSDMTIAANTMLATGAAQANFGDTLNDNQIEIVP